MAKSKELGRIKFKGNPWPKGHAITEFVWSARVERATGIWFDLHLETAAYNAEDPKRGPGSLQEDDEDDDISDWQSKIVWCNYHSCLLSSTAWPGAGYGFQAGSKREPLDIAKIGKRSFRFDSEPVDLGLPRPMNIYLTGHDAVADHKITFKPEPTRHKYTVKWSGKIALTYIGSESFDRQFSAEIQGARFSGITLPTDVPVEEALWIVDPYVVDLQKHWKKQKTPHGYRLMPK